jgi:hypothetical protein
MKMSDELLKILNDGPLIEQKDRLKNASLGILNEYLCVHTTEDDTRRFVQSLIDHKKFEINKNPHWSIVPTFWIAVFVAVLTALSFYFQVIKPLQKMPKYHEQQDTTWQHVLPSKQLLKDTAQK